MKRYEDATVDSVECIAPDIYDMRVITDMAAVAVPGQFAMLYTGDASRMLGRPISICECCEGGLRFVFRVAGGGTRNLAAFKGGDKIKILGPLGNGYDIKAMKGREVLLMGGGIGIPPMLELAKRLSASGIKVRAVMGYRDSNLFLKSDFERVCETHVATEDGSAGTKGNVLDAVREKSLFCDVICACGPMPMLRAIKSYAAGNGITAYISLEERMACGVGACLGCVCKTARKDAHSHVNNARVCTEGPVFEAASVDI